MIQYSGASEQGPVRTNNEDFIAHRSPEEDALRCARGHLFAVADGVGGGQAGEVASKEAAQTLINLYYSLPGTWGRALQEAFQKANEHVYDLGRSRPEYRKMQTTLSAIAVLNNEAIVGHVGDTRIYQVRDREIEQLTRDHSDVAELLRMRLITPDEARHHPRRNVITRSIGSEMLLQAQYRNIEVELGDHFVLCSDGLWEPIEDRELVHAVTRHSPAHACRTLLDLAIERGTSDNLSIQIIKVVEWERNGRPRVARKGGYLRKALRVFRKNQKGA